jgi:hypothetical protein
VSNFEEILKVGGKSNSLGKAGEVLDRVRKDSKKLPELFACISSDDAWVRMRAIDTFEKFVRENPSSVQPYISEIIESLTKSTQPSIQWHIAQLFAEVELDEQQQSVAIHWLKARIETADVDWIVSVNTMKTLLQFNKEGLIKSSELKPLFNTQMNHTSLTVRKKAKLFLAQLQ